MNQRFAVIGLGRFGSAISSTLADRGAEVLAIDNDEEKVDLLQQDVAYAVTLDATDIKNLKAQNIADMDAVIVAIGSNFESLLLITVNLMELGVKRVLCRAMTKTQRLVLERIGVKEIVSPEEEVGISLAEKLMNPGILTFLQLPDQYEIVELEAPANCKNRSIRDLDLRKKYNLNLITVKRCETIIKDGIETREEHVIGVPDPDLILSADDTILVIGKDKDVDRFMEVNK